MIGSAVERQGIIRHGAKMITAVAEATVPTDLGDRAQGVRRRALRDGRSRRSSPTHCLALPTAKIAVMGPRPPINAVYANKIAEIERRRPSGRRTCSGCATEYELDIDILRLASGGWSSTASSSPATYVAELIARFAAAATKDRHFSTAGTACRRCRAEVGGCQSAMRLSAP